MPKFGSACFANVAHLNAAYFGPSQVRCGLMPVRFSCVAGAKALAAGLVRVRDVVSRNTLYTRNGDGRPEWNWPPVPERNCGPDTGL